MNDLWWVKNDITELAQLNIWLLLPISNGNLLKLNRSEVLLNLYTTIPAYRKNSIGG